MYSGKLEAGDFRAERNAHCLALGWVFVGAEHQIILFSMFGAQVHHVLESRDGGGEQDHIVCIGKGAIPELSELDTGATVSQSLSLRRLQILPED